LAGAQGAGYLSGMRALSRALWFLWCPLVALSGCANPELGGETGSEDPKAPGEVLGFYALSGKLTDDSCGAESLNAPGEWSFEVKLSRDRGTLYWLNGREGIVGEIDAAGSFSFETHVDKTLAERRGAAKGCTMRRSDIASGALSNAGEAVSMKLSYAFEAIADSDCTEFTTGTDGQPVALPCSMTYTLSGSRVSAE
jgi:hypothetical protein